MHMEYILSNNGPVAPAHVRQHVSGRRTHFCHNLPFSPRRRKDDVSIPFGCKSIQVLHRGHFVTNPKRRGQAGVQVVRGNNQDPILVFVVE